MQLAPVIERIEELATARLFGQLPQLRRKLKSLAQVHRRIFYFVRSPNTPRAEWSYAFHRGGRHELQFNVGLEDSGETLRYGVAFSFQASRNLTNLGVLRRSVERFNDFAKRNPAYLSRFSMWSYESGRDRTERLAVRPIPEKLFRWGVFVFVGSAQPARTRSIDYSRILDDLDWLIPLYEFVEGKEKALPVKQTKSGFIFQPGCSIHTFSAKAASQARVTEVDLRHKRIQVALHHYLVSRFGTDNVRIELPHSGIRVDAVLRLGKKYWYYEIKTSKSVKDCIRQSLSQLLEYSYWPGSETALKLIIVGEPPIDSDSTKYLSILKSQFNLPVEYQQFDMARGKIVGV
jgi:hypothetical protein